MAVRHSTGSINKILGTNCVKTIYANGIIKCYSGAQPADPDGPATGTYLGDISVDGLTVTEGTTTNCINFDTPSGTSMGIPSGVTWKFKSKATGTIGWGRLQANAVDDNSTSTTLPRVDFSIGLPSSTADAHMTTVTVTAVGQFITLTSASFFGSKG